jgi:hypothetical protein
LLKLFINYSDAKNFKRKSDVKNMFPLEARSKIITPNNFNELDFLCHIPKQNVCVLQIKLKKNVNTHVLLASKPLQTNIIIKDLTNLP